MTSTDTVDDGGQTAVVEQKTDDYVLASEQEAGAPAGGEQEQARENAEKDPNTEQPDQKPKKMGGYQRRIHHLSNENLLLRQQLAEFQQQQQQPAGGKRPEQQAAVAKAQDGEPDIDDFENVLDYLKAHNQWSSEQALKSFKVEQETTAKQQQAQAEYETKQSSFNERVEGLLDNVPDYFERAAALYQQGLITPSIESAILDSPVGEMVTLYFMANPNELAQLAQGTEAQAYRAVALIEAHLLQGQVGQQQAQQGTVKRTTTAAAPITPVKPSATTQSSIRDDVPYEEWVKLREKSLRG